MTDNQTTLEPVAKCSRCGRLFLAPPRDMNDHYGWVDRSECGGVVVLLKEQTHAECSMIVVREEPLHV